MFRPNQYGMLSRRLGANIYGERTWSAPVRVPCGIVDNAKSVVKTPVRSDSSASRGAAEEQVAVVKILFPAKVLIAQDDKFEINDLKLRASAVQLRFSVTGALDHREVDFDILP